MRWLATILFAFATLGLPAPSLAQLECSSFFRETQRDATAPRGGFSLDPSLILNPKLKASDVTFEVSLRLDSMNNENVVFRTYYRGSFALEMRLLRNRPGSFSYRNENNEYVPNDRPVYSVVTDPLRPYRGDPNFFFDSGLGSLAYLTAAKTIFDRWQGVVSSDRLGRDEPMQMVSNKALKVWERLRKEGLARFESPGFAISYVFLASQLADAKFDSLGRFVQQRVHLVDDQLSAPPTSKTWPSAN